jgi:hypothetical protein
MFARFCSPTVGLRARLAPARAVVVADEHAGVVGQRVQALDRGVQTCRVAAGKSQRAVPPSGMKMLSPTNTASPMRIAQAVAGMAGRGDHLDLELAQCEALAIGEQAVELRAVGGESGSSRRSA